MPPFLLRRSAVLVAAILVVLTSFGPAGLSAATVSITSFSPPNGVPGTSVTISGENFITVSSVQFSGIPAAFSVPGSTQITATVPEGASTGPITVQTSLYGTAVSSADFTITPPAITSFSPVKVVAGTMVDIYGSGLTAPTAVSFNGTPASGFGTDSDSHIYAWVPASATSGPISVTTVGGTATSASSFERIPGLIANPTFDTDVSPWHRHPSGLVGTWSSADASGNPSSGSILLTNTSDHASDSADQCANVTPGMRYVLGANAWVPAAQPKTGIASVRIIWRTDCGEGDGFLGSVGSDPLVGRRVGGWESLYVADIAPAGATRAVVQLSLWPDAGGAPNSFQAYFDNVFFDVERPPSLYDFTPSSGIYGTGVLIHGADFYGATAVRFNGVPASSFRVFSDSGIVTFVPLGASTGPISVETPAGSAVSASSFYAPQPPVITSFTPALGRAGTPVYVYGENLAETETLRFNGISAPFTVISSLTEPPYLQTAVPAGATTGPIQASNIAGSSTTLTDFVVRIPQDFNGDNAPDLLWRNYASGDVAVWYISTSAFVGGKSLGNVTDPNWRLETSADFDGNGTPDLIWRNYSTGQINIWFLNGTAYVGSASLFTIADLNWEIESAADFNGDAHPDLLWRNYSTGQVSVWFMNGTSYAGGAALFSVADPNWKLEGSGDFDKDGDPDLVWRNYATGSVNVWMLDGTTYVSGAALFSVADPNWKIQAIEDYDGNGGPDLVWRHYGTGAVNLWRLNGTAYVSGATLGTVPDANWQIAGPR